MRCCAHILNLIVKDGLDVLKGGIEKIRDSSNYWIATPKRVEFFQESAKQLRIPCEKKLVHDCPTRWNSTYYMLSVALPESDWEFAALVCKKLEIFSEISDLFSGTSYPTANLFFLKIWDLNEALSEWLLDSHHVIRNMAELIAIIPRSSDFDILMWWKMNGVKFQTLQAIAKDVLAIPITSVASEYSFSAGGRLLDPHHSRLHYTMVESMMCTRSWIKDDLKLGISNIS
ncbi:Putative AC transposase [Linum perenne]